MKDQPIHYLFTLKEETNDFSMLNYVIYLTSKQMTREHWNKIMTLESIVGFNIPLVRLSLHKYKCLWDVREFKYSGRSLFEKSHQQDLCRVFAGLLLYTPLEVRSCAWNHAIATVKSTANWSHIGRKFSN